MVNKKDNQKQFLLLALSIIVILVFIAAIFGWLFFSSTNANNDLLVNCNSQSQLFKQQTDSCNQSLFITQQGLIETTNNLATCNAESLNAIKPPYTYVEGRKVHTIFKLMDGDLSGWETPIESYDYYVKQESFMNTLTIQQLQLFGFQDILSRYNKYSGNKELLLFPAGAITTTITILDYRPYIDTESIRPIADALVKRSSSDGAFINEVFNMIKQITTYTTEQDAHFPLTTLISAGGDCKNTTILVASLLKSAHPEWIVDIVYLDADNPENPKTINHTVVYVDTGNYKTFIETTSKNQINPYTNIIGYYFHV